MPTTTSSINSILILEVKQSRTKAKLVNITTMVSQYRVMKRYVEIQAEIFRMRRIGKLDPSYDEKLEIR